MDAKDIARASPAGLAWYASGGAWILAPHLKLLSQKIVDVATGRCPRLIVTMPPRHGKSELVSRTTPAWYLGNFPDRKVMLASYADTFAADWGRQSRTMLEEFGQPLWGVGVNQLAAGGQRWEVKPPPSRRGVSPGVMVTAGVGGGLTGKGAHLLIIDDPIKNAEEAQSARIRDTHHDWWRSTARTRLQKGSGVILVMCMTGDTSVLMADGSERPLRDVRPGDVAATYENGAVTTARVLNWANQGPDRIITVRMKSGRTASGNARHPFRVLHDDGSETWVQLGSLKVGMKVRSVEAPTQGSNAPTRAVALRRGARACVCPTTAKCGGPQDTAPPQPATLADERFDSRAATESPSRTMSGSSRSRAVPARSAGSGQAKSTGRSTGPRSFASTTTPDGCAVCSATTATSLLAERTPQTSFERPLATWSVRSDEVAELVEVGVEDVFDIEVERTHNFIANGLQVSNTRWHEDDLAGRLLADELDGGDQWEVLNLPAICECEGEDTDVLGRHGGDVLWPEMFDEEFMTRTRAAQGSYWFSAMYQQRPSPADGMLFKRENLRYFDWKDEAAGLLMMHTDAASTIFDINYGTVFQTVDVAGSSKQESDFTVVSTWCVTPNRDLLWLDCERVKFESLDVAGFVRRSFFKHNPTLVGIERLGFGLTVIQELLRDGLPVVRLEPDKDKVSRALPAVARTEEHRVFLPARAEWREDAEAQMLAFPNAAHDDIVDTLSYAALQLPTLGSRARFGDGGMQRERGSTLTGGLLKAQL